MADLKQFKLPDVGEGLTEADILKWAVQPGDAIVVNQILVEVETAKAAVELPSPFAGVVRSLEVAEGSTVEVGTPIITIEVGASQAAAEVVEKPAGEPKREAVLVGYGPRAGARSRRRRPGPAPTHLPEPSANAAFQVPPSAESVATARPLAKPPVRKMAKELGVDLRGVPATGPNGTVTREDVAQAAATETPVPSGDRETRVPIRGVRKHTAEAMVASAFTAPHVTEFVTLDITPTLELRDRVAARREFKDIKVTPLLFVAKAVILAVRRTPEVNATWDEAEGVIVLKNFVNLGIAAATNRGLIVPNIKDADRLSLLELAQALASLTATAREGRTSPADMSGGTFTITNVGVFGVDTGTPIINPGESAILAFGAVRKMPWVIDDQIVPRWVTQLALSFDHRLVDGQQGSQFLADVAAILSDPGLALL